MLQTKQNNDSSNSNAGIYEIELSDNNLSEAISLFSNNGFVILKNSMPISLVKEVYEDVIKIIRQNRISNSVRDLHLFPNGEISSAHRLTEYVPSYRKFHGLKNIRFSPIR